MEKPRILICGVGRIGEALASIIAPTREAEIALWDIDTQKISHSFTPQHLARGANYILLCLPSSTVREFITSIAADIQPGTMVVSLVKGLDKTTGKTMHEVLQELLSASVSVAILGGPMLSGELLQGRFAYGVAACDTAVFSQLKELFAPTRLKIEYSSDMPGVAAVGVLKNIYALGLGIAAALEVGDNARGWLVTQALHEMRVLVPALGGTPETVFTLAGLGDFVATAYSQHSRNRTVGEELVTHKKVTIASEGLLTLPILLKRVADISSYPFLQVIRNVVLEGKDARREFQRFITR